VCRAFCAELCRVLFVKDRYRVFDSIRLDLLTDLFVGDHRFVALVKRSLQ
jgi:hypothetical protein